VPAVQQVERALEQVLEQVLAQARQLPPVG
jgi:hypothetical protein